MGVRRELGARMPARGGSIDGGLEENACLPRVRQRLVSIAAARGEQ